MLEVQQKSEIEWIFAHVALARLIPLLGEHGAKSALIKRAHADIIRTKAKQLTREQLYGEKMVSYDAEVPPRFYWAETGGALTANWRSGDFESHVKDPLLNVKWSVIGLQFDLRGVQELESECSPPRQASAPVVGNSAGRPTRYDWEGALIGLIGLADMDGLNVPSGQGAIARLSELLASEFSKFGGGEPAKSELDKRASRILKAIYPAPDN